MCSDNIPAVSGNTSTVFQKTINIDGNNMKFVILVIDKDKQRNTQSNLAIRDITPFSAKNGTLFINKFIYKFIYNSLSFFYAYCFLYVY
jgi:hypothetical protein